MKILVIDDESSILNSLEPLLTLFEHDVVTANDGQDGLEKYFKSPQAFDVVVTDIDMPKVDGVEVAKTLTAKGHPIPIIFMTGNPDIPNLADINHLGLLKKPFKINSLLNLLQQVEA